MPEETKDTKEKKAPVVIEKPTNCMKCNKHLQKKAWYYRDNAYYCSKRCWKLATTSKKKEEAKKA